MADILDRAKDTYKELDKSGEVSSAKVTKEMNTEIVSPSFMTFARKSEVDIMEASKDPFIVFPQSTNNQ